MKTQFKPDGFGDGMATASEARRGADGVAGGLPELDTYKQFARVSAGAASKRFRVSIRDDSGIPLWMCIEAIKGNLSPLEFLLLRRSHHAH